MLSIFHALCLWSLKLCWSHPFITQMRKVRLRKLSCPRRCSWPIAEPKSLSRAVWHPFLYCLWEIRIERSTSVILQNCNFGSFNAWINQSLDYFPRWALYMPESYAGTFNFWYKDTEICFTSFIIHSRPWHMWAFQPSGIRPQQQLSETQRTIPILPFVLQNSSLPMRSYAPSGDWLASPPGPWLHCLGWGYKEQSSQDRPGGLG